MLVQLKESPVQSSFRELYEIALQLLECAPGRKTMVIGPVTADTEEEKQQNLLRIQEHSKRLVQEGWVVFDLTSFQSAIQYLVERFGITGYPHEILEEFTLPLIRSGIFSEVHALEQYITSYGATREHNTALEENIPIVYIP